MGNFCAFCGKPIIEGANFCVACGKPVAVSPAPNQNTSTLFTEPAPPINNNAYSQPSQQIINNSVPVVQNAQYAQNQMVPQQYTNPVYQAPNNTNIYPNKPPTPYVPNEITLVGLVFNYFFGGFSGRCRLLELWLTAFMLLFLQTLFIGIPCGAAFYYFRDNPQIMQYMPYAAYAINIVLTLINFLPSIMMTTRRLHDLDFSGWWQLFFYVPVFGWLFMLYVIFCPGDKGHNRYG